MRQGKHRLVGRAAVALAAVVSLAACGGGSLGTGEESGGGSGGADGAEDTVKVGLLVSQSGVYSSVGEDMANGFRLYVDQHDGKLGGRDVEIVTADEGESAETGVAGATRLVQQDQVDVVVGVVASPTATGSADLFTTSQVPVIVGNSGATALGGEKASEWIWRAAYSNEQPGMALGAHLAETLPADQKVYLMAADYTAGHETLEGFKQTFPADRIAGEAYTPFGTTSDFQPYLAKIRQSGASAVFTFYAGREAIDFTQQYAQFGLAGEVQLYSTGFLTEGSALEAEGEAALGVRTVIRYNADLDNPTNQEFAPAYEEAYGGVPTVYAATMYDVGIVLDQALSNVDGEVTPAAIKDGLTQVGEVDGVRGTWEFDDTRTPVQQFYLREVQEVDGELRNVVIDTLPLP